MRKITLGVACLIAGLGTGAQADGIPGTYVRLDSGWSWAEDANIKDRDFANTPSICGDALCTVPGSLDDIGDSFIIGGGVGYRFTSLFRADATIAYRGGFELDDKDALFIPTSFSGDLTVWSFMANAYFDVPVNLGIFKPYVGAGIGAATIEFEDISANNSGFITGSPDGRHTNFAWQLMAGTTVELAKGVSLDVGYRYFDGGDFGGDAGLATGALAGFPYGGSEGDLTSHEVTVGVLYDF